jgi:anti-anti-sigma regulatory factor
MKEPKMELKGKIEDNDVLVIELNEDNLDASNAREFRDAVQSMMHERTSVVLDVSSPAQWSTWGLQVVRHVQDRASPV